MQEGGRLIRLAVEAISMNAAFIPGAGWRVSVRYRRQGETWDHENGVLYDRLSSAELADVLDVELPRAIFGEA